MGTFPGTSPLLAPHTSRYKLVTLELVSGMSCNKTTIIAHNIILTVHLPVVQWLLSEQTLDSQAQMIPKQSVYGKNVG